MPGSYLHHSTNYRCCFQPHNARRVPRKEPDTFTLRSSTVLSFDVTIQATTSNLQVANSVSVLKVEAACTSETTELRGATCQKTPLVTHCN